jgi:biotin transport system substrate-specific component
MTTITTTPRSTLIDRAVPRTLLSDIALVVAGAALTGVLAQVSVPLWPVPITGQTLAVLLVGASLGAARGAASLALYAVLGIVGVPWFSDASSGLGVVAGPTGGYILGFILAAALTGWLAQRQWDRRIVGAFVSFLVGSISTFAIGLPWLASTLGLDLAQTLEAGLYPFIIGGLIKSAIAAGLVRGAWAIADSRGRGAAAHE